MRCRCGLVMAKMMNCEHLTQSNKSTGAKWTRLFLLHAEDEHEAVILGWRLM